LDVLEPRLHALSSACEDVATLGQRYDRTFIVIGSLSTCWLGSHAQADHPRVRRATRPIISAPHVHRITKYDPADRDDRGAYRGSEDASGDHGSVEVAYLAAVKAFTEDSGVTGLTIRDPAVSGVVHFGVKPPVDDHGCTGSATTGTCGRKRATVRSR
jgi:hypothetical protein